MLISIVIDKIKKLVALSFSFAPKAPFLEGMIQFENYEYLLALASYENFGVNEAYHFLLDLVLSPLEKQIIFLNNM